MTNRFATASRTVLFLLGALAALPQPARAADDPLLAAGAETYKFPAIETYREIVERPLFAADRRPAPVAMAADKGLASTIMLTGVILLPEARYAVVKEGAAAVRSVTEGTHLSAGTVERITAEGISLRLADGRIAAMAVVRPALAQVAMSQTTATEVATVAQGSIQQMPTPHPSAPYAGAVAAADDGRPAAPPGDTFNR